MSLKKEKNKKKTKTKKKHVALETRMDVMLSGHSRPQSPFVSFGHVIGETGGSGNTENQMS